VVLKKLRMKRLACLGLCSCEVTVDPERSTVTVVRQIGWVVKTRPTIPFHKIRCVAYCFQGPPAWLANSPDYQGGDSFTVGLRLHDQTYIHLFSFRGSCTGTQEEESRTYAEQLGQMIGVPLSR
jgi:hypothetical protein